jgi:predicted enzyme related to lactoylglutathione lyase
MYRVDDIHVAVENVRRAGGRAGPVEEQPYGLMARCTDDQGGAFYLGQM